MGKIILPMRCDGEHWEYPEPLYERDGFKRYKHSGYTNLTCPKCDDYYLVSNEMRQKARNCGKEKCAS